MKTVFAISDIHVDFLYTDDKDDHTLEETVPLFEKLFANLALPKTDYLIVAGDISNDFLTFQHFCYFIKDKYEKIFIVCGNHDFVVKGSTTSKANQIFKLSKDRLQGMKDECLKYSNIILLDGNVVDGIGGTMGMCDFEYKPYININYTGYWKMHWFDGKHWRLTTDHWNANPYDFFKEEAEKIRNIIKQQPKVLVTHFSPVQATIPTEYIHDMVSCFFVFNGEEFLEQMPNDSYWICGHTHGFASVDYKCKNGNIVHIIRNPLGYLDARTLTSTDGELKKEPCVFTLSE